MIGNGFQIVSSVRQYKRYGFNDDSVAVHCSLNNHNKLYYRVKNENFEFYTYAFKWNTASKFENDLIP